jgi:hypothetical protein
MRRAGQGIELQDNEVTLQAKIHPIICPRWTTRIIFNSLVTYFVTGKLAKKLIDNADT